MLAPAAAAAGGSPPKKEMQGPPPLLTYVSTPHNKTLPSRDSSGEREMGTDEKYVKLDRRIRRAREER